MAQRGAYAKGIAKRDEILTVALDVIARHGYRGASVREIADAVGLSQAGLLHYFGSKDALFTAVLVKRDEHDAPAVPGDDALEGLVRVVAHNAHVPGLVQLYAQLSVEASDPDHPAHGYFAERFARLRERFARSLRAGQSDGTLREGFDPEATAALVIAAADGLQVQFLLDPSFDMAATLRAMLDDLRA